MIKSIVYLTIIFLFINSNANAFDDDYSIIEVKGDAKVSVEPNTFTLSLSIVEIGRVPTKIKAVVDNKSDLVVQAAKDLGVKLSNINSAKIYIRPFEEKPSITIQGLAINQKMANNQKGRVFVGVDELNDERHNTSHQKFELSRRITVIFSNIEHYDQFLTKVMKIEVNNISQLNMSASNIEQHYQQALKRAITNAKQKANRIAKQTELSLGKIVYLKELSSGSAQPRFRQALFSEQTSPVHASQTGYISISASVLIKFAIEE